MQSPANKEKAIRKQKQSPRVVCRSTRRAKSIYATPRVRKATKVSPKAAAAARGAAEAGAALRRLFEQVGSQDRGVYGCRVCVWGYVSGLLVCVCVAVGCVGVRLRHGLAAEAGAGWRLRLLFRLVRN